MISDLISKSKTLWKHLVFICRYYLYNLKTYINDIYFNKHLNVYYLAIKVICKLLNKIPSKLTEKGLN